MCVAWAQVGLWRHSKRKSTVFGEKCKSCSCPLHFSAVSCSVHPHPHPPQAQTSLSTLNSNTHSQCSSLMYRPSFTPIQYAQQTVAIFAMFLDSKRQYKILERTVPGIPTVSSVPSCFVVALRIAGVALQYLNWHLVVLHSVRKTRVFS